MITNVRKCEFNKNRTENHCVNQMPEINIKHLTYLFYLLVVTTSPGLKLILTHGNLIFNALSAYQHNATTVAQKYQASWILYEINKAESQTFWYTITTLIQFATWLTLIAPLRGLRFSVWPGATYHSTYSENIIKK